MQVGTSISASFYHLKVLFQPQRPIIRLGSVLKTKRECLRTPFFKFVFV
jgi:hypothetical protein